MANETIPTYWHDPLWSALERCIERFKDNPVRLLYEKTPDYEEGFDSANINRLAEETGLGPVFGQREDEQGRWLDIFSPDRPEPVSWRKVPWDRGTPESKIARTAGCLKAWQAKRAEQLGEAGPPAADPGPPDKLLTTWRMILDALELTHNQEERQRVKGLNEHYAGPLVNRGRGKQPAVEKRKLLDWWNHLEGTMQDKAHQKAGAKHEAEASHPYGREGTVAPEIGGSHKKRRKPRS